MEYVFKILCCAHRNRFRNPDFHYFVAFQNMASRHKDAVADVKR